MPHIRVEPMKEFENIAQRMKKFIDEFPDTLSVEFGRGFEPKVDIFEDEHSVYISVELAGVRKEDVRVSFKDDVVTIAGTKPPSNLAEHGEAIRCETSYGDFSRQIPVPAKVNGDKIEAAMKHGVLTVTLAKERDASHGEININIA